MMDRAERVHLRALCERRSQASMGITMLPREVQDLLDDADAADRQRGEVVRRVRVALGRMGVADCDDVCDALDSAVDEMERRDREAVDEANELRRERDEARAEAARLRAEVVALETCIQRARAAADHIPQHLGATWWGQQLRAALATPAEREVQP